MSNPVGAYVVYSVYDNYFRDAWLKAAISAGEYADVCTVNLSILRDLYPFVYNYGPRGNNLHELIKILNSRFDAWYEDYETGNVEVPGNSMPPAAAFFDEMRGILKLRPQLDPAVVSRLHDQMRPMQFTSKVDFIGQGGEVARLRKNQGRIIRLAGRSRSVKHEPAFQDLEFLLTDVMLADVLIANQPGYHRLLTDFLKRWQLI